MWINNSVQYINVKKYKNLIFSQFPYSFCFLIGKKVLYTWFWWGWGRSSPNSQRCSCLLGPWERHLSTGSSDAQNNRYWRERYWTYCAEGIQQCTQNTVGIFNINNPPTYLWRWQASCSFRAHRQHSEFLGCAALTVWRGSEGVPLWTSQHIFQSRVNQGYLPLCGDVVTGEISASWRRWNKSAQRTVWNKSNREGYSLQWFIHHAASPKARLVQQHLTKVAHLSIHRTLITVMDKMINTTSTHLNTLSILSIY